MWLACTNKTATDIVHNIRKVKYKPKHGLEPQTVYSRYFPLNKHKKKHQFEFSSFLLTTIKHILLKHIDFYQTQLAEKLFV